MVNSAASNPPLMLQVTRSPVDNAQRGDSRHVLRHIELFPGAAGDYWGIVSWDGRGGCTLDTGSSAAATTTASSPRTSAASGMPSLTLYTA